MSNSVEEKKDKACATTTCSGEAQGKKELENKLENEACASAQTKTSEVKKSGCCG